MVFQGSSCRPIPFHSRVTASQTLGLCKPRPESEDFPPPPLGSAASKQGKKQRHKNPAWAKPSPQHSWESEKVAKTAETADVGGESPQQNRKLKEDVVDSDDSLLDFASDLDFEKYIDAYEVREALEVIRSRVADHRSPHGNILSSPKSFSTPHECSSPIELPTNASPQSVNRAAGIRRSPLRQNGYGGSESVVTDSTIPQGPHPRFVLHSRKSIEMKQQELRSSMNMKMALRGWEEEDDDMSSVASSWCSYSSRPPPSSASDKRLVKSIRKNHQLAHFHSKLSIQNLVQHSKATPGG